MQQNQEALLAPNGAVRCFGWHGRSAPRPVTGTTRCQKDCVLHAMIEVTQRSRRGMGDQP